MNSIYLRPEHEVLQDQVARFIAREVEPHALAWEASGMVPRDVLRKMGQAGFFGLMYESEYGGAEADALTNLVFAEALSQSTFAGFIVSVLVHTDMASPHLHHAGTAEQKARYMPGVTRGETTLASNVSMCAERPEAFRVSSTVIRPPAASTNARAMVAMPESRCRKFSAVLSPTRSVAASPSTHPISSPA